MLLQEDGRIKPRPPGKTQTHHPQLTDHQPEEKYFLYNSTITRRSSMKNNRENRVMRTSYIKVIFAFLFPFLIIFTVLQHIGPFKFSSYKEITYDEKNREIDAWSLERGDVIDRLDTISENIHKDRTEFNKTLKLIHSKLTDLMKSEKNSVLQNVAPRVDGKKKTRVRCPKTYKNPSGYVIKDSVRAPCITRYLLVILISTHVSHYDRRGTIRETWADASRWNIRGDLPWTVVFNIGYVNKTHKISHKLREEMKHHGDLIVGDVKESFYTLSKKLSIGIDWLHRNLVFDFVLKTDDDVFINIPKVLKALNTLPSHIQYFGHVMWRQPVERKGRYKLTPDEFKHDRFDPYCSGGGFIVRQGVIEKIAWYLVFNRPLKYEDAYFGSLAFKAGVVPSKAYDKYFLMRNHKCIYHEEMFLSHRSGPRCMKSLMIRSSTQIDHF